jgi:tetratricopeptide (TPR) repeat protein
MNKPTVHKTITLTALIVFVSAVPVFAQADASGNIPSKGNRGYIGKSDIPETKKGTTLNTADADTMDSSVLNLSKQDEENLTQLQKQARLYRAQGFQYQSLGNLDSAMGLYQKAVQLDPTYAAAYNDLGVVYEALGFIDRAEQSYLQSVRIDPNLLSGYSNLALLYENERDLDKAAFFWAKRAQMGLPTDPWTLKARQRLEDIRAITSNRPLQDMREQEIVDLMTDVAVYKDLLKKDDKALAASYMRKCKQFEKKGDEVSALKMAIDAQQLDPTNEDIQEYVDKLQIRNLSK